MTQLLAAASHEGNADLAPFFPFLSCADEEEGGSLGCADGGPSLSEEASATRATGHKKNQRISLKKITAVWFSDLSLISLRKG